MEHVLINYSKIYDWSMVFSLFVSLSCPRTQIHKYTQFFFFFHFNRIDEHEFRTRQIIDKNITTRWPILFMPLQWNIPVLRKSSIELIYSMGHLFSIRISFFIAMNKYPINFFSLLGSTLYRKYWIYVWGHILLIHLTCFSVAYCYISFYFWKMRKLFWPKVRLTVQSIRSASLFSRSLNISFFFRLSTSKNMSIYHVKHWVSNPRRSKI